MITIGQIIRDIRKRKGLTQAALGEAAGLSTMSVRRYESGERVIPEPTLNEISKALGEDVKEAYLAERKREDDEKFAGLAHVINSLGRLQRLEKQYPLVLSAEFLHQPDTHDLLSAFNLLNEEGRQLAITNVEAIAGNSIYQRTDPVEATERPSEAFTEDKQGESSTTQEKPPEGK